MVTVPNFKVTSDSCNAVRFWTNGSYTRKWILNCIVINLQLLLCLPYEMERFRTVRTRTFRHGIPAIVHLWPTKIDENSDDSWGGLSPAFRDATENEEYPATDCSHSVMKGLSNSSISLLYPIEAVEVGCIDSSGSGNSFINLTLWSMKQSAIEVNLWRGGCNDATLWGEKESVCVWRVPKQCPLVLLIKVRLREDKALGTWKIRRDSCELFTRDSVST
jgi:hypothetical protein